MLKRDNIVIASLISITPALLAFWLISQTAALVAFVLVFIAALVYLQYQTQRQPNEVLEIFHHAETNQLQILANNDLIRTIDLSQYPSIQEAIKQEISQNTASLKNLISQVQFININDRELEQQLNQQFASR